MYLPATWFVQTLTNLKAEEEHTHTVIQRILTLCALIKLWNQELTSKEETVLHFEATWVKWGGGAGDNEDERTRDGRREKRREALLKNRLLEKGWVNLKRWNLCHILSLLVANYSSFFLFCFFSLFICSALTSYLSSLLPCLSLTPPFLMLLFHILQLPY